MPAARAAPLVVVVAFVAGCSAIYRAELVNRPGGARPSANAPVNEASRPGLVRCLNEGIAAVRDRRREAAYRTMR
jgi:hypothetical protein